MPPVPPRTMRTVVALLVCALVATLALAPAATAGLTRKEQRVKRAVNKARANHGLGTLRVRSILQRDAHKRAGYLLRYNVFYHGSLASGVSENLAWITCRKGWPRAVVRMWLNSSAHRANLLDRSARYVGIGVATGNFAGYGCTHIVVARFK